MLDEAWLAISIPIHIKKMSSPVKFFYTHTYLYGSCLHWGIVILE